jgi:protocatechuate 3,4-dioxygenase beta subunit
LRARLRVWFVKTRTFRSSSIYGQRVVVRGRLRDLRGHGVQGARIDVYHLRRTGAPPPREDGPEDPARTAT